MRKIHKKGPHKPDEFEPFLVDDDEIKVHCYRDYVQPDGHGLACHVRCSAYAEEDRWAHVRAGMIEGKWVPHVVACCLAMPRDEKGHAAVIGEFDGAVPQRVANETNQ